MQLKAGGIAATLGVLAGALLGSSPASAQAEAAPANAYDRSASEVGALIADTALLVY